MSSTDIDPSNLEKVIHELGKAELKNRPGT